MSPSGIGVNDEALCDEKTQELLGQDLEAHGPEGLGLRALSRRNCWEQIGKLKSLKG